MEDERKPQEKFNFTAEGESLDYISLDEARVRAIEYARDHAEFYGPTYKGVNLVWESVSAEESEDHYEIRLSFRPSGRFQGEPGLEQFIFDKTGGLRIRQMLDEPKDVEPSSGTVASAIPRSSPPTMPPAQSSDRLPDQPSTTGPSLSQDVLRRINRAGPTIDQNVLNRAERTRKNTGLVTSRGWLIETAVNLVKRLLRRERWTRLGENEGLSDPGPSSTQPRETTPVENLGNIASERYTSGRPTPSISPTRSSSVKLWLRRISGMLLGLWGAALMLGSGNLLSEGQSSAGAYVLLGSVITLIGSVLLWPWTRQRLARLGNRLVIIGLIGSGFVLFGIGMSLAEW